MTDETDKNVDHILFATQSSAYGDKYAEHFLDQYKVYLASAEAISDRRQKANEFFLAVNTALVTILGFFIADAEAAKPAAILIPSSVSGIVICYLWYRLVVSYKGLNGAKFKVIHAIERRLPLGLYDSEWEMLGRGEDRKLYWPFTHIERLVPWTFMLIYLVLLLTSLPWTRLLAAFPR